MRNKKRRRDKTHIPFLARKKVRDSLKLLKLADKKVKDMGDLIDLPMDVFETYCKEHFNLGQTKMLKDQLRLTYDNVVQRKDGLVKECNNCSDAVEKARFEDTIKRLFLVLQRVEDRIVFLEKRERELLDVNKDN